MNKKLFPARPQKNPTIYAYEDTNPAYKGWLKVGYTVDNVERRVAAQYPSKRPTENKPYRIVFSAPALYPDGNSFMDHKVHRMLERKGFIKDKREWFKCTVNDVKAAWIAVKNKSVNYENRIFDFKLRPEQEAAICKTIQYYQIESTIRPSKPAKFLWNAKMRFGKTFASYHLAKRMDLSKILILTFKPAVQSAWEKDLLTHVDFEGWQFISRTSGLNYENADLSKPIVCFGSFQDYLGTNESGGIKAKNEWVHSTNWDLVIFDEYHFGAWR
ncbi:MAG: GIY-YIG nuclease family protein, partial [Bacteroidales bacterium]|nr:GIY-YIG nuclease family protein [Bacteroidales bacterium]